MASALLRRRLVHIAGLAQQRRLFSSTFSVLAQAAPQGQGSSPTTTAPGGINAFNRHIAEGLQGVSASEILAESGTRKDAQMRHFTGEGYANFSSFVAGSEVLKGPPYDLVRQ
jgi:NADH dehydrogenase (ubiquinone) Fe-S protein 2